MLTGFEHLTDTQLEEQLLDLVRRQCALNAEVVKQLFEVEARRLRARGLQADHGGAVGYQIPEDSGGHQKAST